MVTFLHSRTSRRQSWIARTVALLTLAAAAASLGHPAAATSGHPATPSDRSHHDPSLVGRAVLPYDTLADGPPAGAFVVPSTQNGVTFPLAAQPVQGFSGIIDGERRGEYLALADNGFGGKANSPDFLIRAYVLRPDFKTADGGSGTIEVADFISFRDPDRKFPFPIVNEATPSRLLTGGDIDPESLQRARNGDLWVGDEFGPWILHFDAEGRLLDPPYEVPGVRSPNHPGLGTAAATQPNSRGFEAMALSRNGKVLHAALEGATVARAGETVRNVYEFDIAAGRFTDRVRHYTAEAPAHMVADMVRAGPHHVVLIERDGGRGEAALFRKLYLVDLRADDTGALDKTELVDLTAVPDPDGVSLPALHPGDLGLGDPFWVMCESVEAVHVVSRKRLLVGCDNNLPNSGRNPSRPDDNELIVVAVPHLRR